MRGFRNEQLKMTCSPEEQRLEGAGVILDSADPGSKRIKQLKARSIRNTHSFLSRISRRTLYIRGSDLFAHPLEVKVVPRLYNFSIAYSDYT